MSSKSIFISFRRESSEHLSQLIFNNLEIRGYDVFMNIVTPDDDPFDARIQNEIEKRPHFLVLLSSGSLEPCIKPDDPFRLEIEHAIDLQKNVIPLCEEGFNFRNYQEYLIGKLSQLSHYEGTRLFNDYFEAALHDLEHRFLNNRSRNQLKIDSNLVLSVTLPYRASDELVHSAKSKVQIILDGDIANFDQKEFTNALSGMLDVPQKEITILRAAEGSILIQIELPTDAAKRLYDLVYQSEDQLHTLYRPENASRNIDRAPSTRPNPSELLKAKEHKENKVKPTVLIVDDEEGFLQIIQVILKRAGYKTFLANDGIMALEIIYKDRPDIIILDDMMPGMTGGEVCKQIKGDARIRDTIVIMHSSGAKIRNPEYIKQIKADGVLFKPSLPNEIIDMLNRLR